MPGVGAADPAALQRLIWIDLEMTGLDPDRDSILEIATIVTDAQLNELACGPVHAISTPLEKLQAMDDWNRSHHGRSGLWQRALDEGVLLGCPPPVRREPGRLVEHHHGRVVLR